MTSSLNGFTGRPRKDPGFVSAGQAMRQSETAARFASSDPSYQQAAQARAREANARIFSASSGADSATYGQGYRTSASGAAILSYGSTTDGSFSFNPEKLEAIPEVERRWSWVEIDLNAIRFNASMVKSRLSPGTRLMAVVKADGYGHGAVQCAKTALNSGAEYLGVATVDEAIELREARVFAPILVLAEPPMSAIPLLLGYKIMPAIYSPEFAISYAEAADAIGCRAPFHLAVNTGMNRIGVRYDEVVPFMQQVGFHRALELVGTFTHYATADCAETLDFQIQTRHFIEAVNALRQAGFNPGIVHAANSAAAIRYPDVQFDMVRLGISLYGYYPCPEAFTLIELKPAMRVKARITDTRLVPMSEGVSYGLHYRSPGSVKICTLPIGYGDGLRRGLSSKIDFLCGGARVRQVGNICMDQCMFEVDMRSFGTRQRIDTQIGDVVTIIGEEGDAAVTVEAMCEVLGTIPHEVTIGLGNSRMPRLYR